MREIKFRAWDKKVEKLYPYITVYAQDFGHVQVNEGGEDKFIYPIHLELMQYTGLKDKNGVEIYEGDVVKGGKFEEYSHFEIVWREEDTCFEASQKQNDKLGGILTRPIGSTLKINEVEVIGNIYENPKLIEEKHGK